MEKYATLRPLAGRKKGDLGEMFRCMADRLSAVEDLGCVRFHLIDKEVQHHWSLVMEDQGCRVHQEPLDAADLEVITRMDTWRQIAEGKLSPLVAFARGKLRIRGDEELGKRLLKRLGTPDGKTDICG